MRNEDVFVDNSGLVVGGDGGDVVRTLKAHSQKHERFLHVMGEIGHAKMFLDISGGMGVERRQGTDS